MKFLVNGFQAVPVDMGINLGCGDIGMAEHKLYGAEIGTVGEQVGGKGVAKGMGGEFVADSGGSCGIVYDLPEAQTGHGFCTIANKQGVAASALQD